MCNIIYMHICKAYQSLLVFFQQFQWTIENLPLYTTFYTPHLSNNFLIFIQHTFIIISDGIKVIASTVKYN